MKTSRFFLTSLFVAAFMFTAISAKAEDDMMNSMPPQQNNSSAMQGDSSDSSDVDQDHDQMKEDHKKMMKDHKKMMKKDSKSSASGHQMMQKMGKKKNKKMPMNNSGMMDDEPMNKDKSDNSSGGMDHM